MARSPSRSWTSWPLWARRLAGVEEDRDVNMNARVRFLRIRKLFFFIVAGFVLSSFAADGQDRAAWLKEARWGVMTHYLADWKAREFKLEMNVDQWNKMVDNFDVEGIASQLQAAGAGYYLISIGQNSGY